MHFSEAAISTNPEVPNRNVLYGDFERLYIACRRKEKRLYTDEELAALPFCSASNPNHAEWTIRKRSAERLCHYLCKRKQALTILEIGCGNGWLCHLLSAIPSVSVTGIDINYTELHQAARVFGIRKNLRFVFGDIMNGALKGHTYDVIVLAASAQYFASIPQLARHGIAHLRNDGEIHIIDTPFYSSERTAADARFRSETYYAGIGAPAMASCYYHHCRSSLAGFNHTFLYDPRNRLQLWRWGKHPFPWVRIKNEAHV